MEYRPCRAAWRVMRIPGMPGIPAARRRLGLLGAPPMWPRPMPGPDLSKPLLAHSLKVLDRAVLGRGPPPGHLDLLGRCIAAAGGRPVWSERFAPP